MSTYTSRTSEIAARLRQAVDAGLTASAETYRTEVKRRIAPGYTSGAFVTGHVLGSVVRSAPDSEGPGVRVIHVGSNVDYALFWEVGHQNLFMRRFAQHQIWAPALADTADARRTAFRVAFNAVMGGDAAPLLGVSEAAD
ncbi:MAG TPA: hypothetical protein VN607_08575 [Gemmatimonadaceae bacterium]|nr:hypothetical protein [Gemmatimonadaceae bacterium]